MRYDDETALALQSVIEGDAERVADDYYHLQSASWRQSIDAAQGQSTSTVPVIDTLDAIPHIVGESLVKGVCAAGGNAAVDRAFRTPPTTSLQLLHPAQWLAGRLPAPHRPAWPTLGPGKLADRGVLGVLGFWFTVDADRPDVTAAAALDGGPGTHTSAPRAAAPPASWTSPTSPVLLPGTTPWCSCSRG
jgi:hypothetical protein